MTRAFLPSRDLMYMEIFFHVLIIFFFGYFGTVLLWWYVSFGPALNSKGEQQRSC